MNKLARFGRKTRSLFGIVQPYFRGWSTPHKIVVIESDDWGSIRTSSRAAYDHLVRAGYAMDKVTYNYDALETDEDLEKLFGVLDSVRDGRGRPACLTANMIMANPDFERIRQGDFQQYFYEPVDATLSRDSRRSNVAALWKSGLDRGIFIPQLHGREHPRWWEWMAALRGGNAETRLAFDLGMCGVGGAISKEGLEFFVPPYVDDEQLARVGVDLEAMVVEGADLFVRQFGYMSRTAIAPNFAWTDHVEQIWASLGIKYIQSTCFQVYYAAGQRRRRARYLGQMNRYGQRYLLRNCVFEPASEKNSLRRCLRQIQWAFAFHKPAVINTHRVNYSGSILPANRQNNLALLSQLLGEVVSRWPNVQFLSSSELGDLMDEARPAMGWRGGSAATQPLRVV